MGAYTVNNGKIFGLMGFNKFLENILTLSSNNDSIKLHETKIIEITKNGTGIISIVNNNPSVISATLSENTITIIGLTDGNASITVNVARDIDYDSVSATYNCSVTKLSNNATISSNNDSILEGDTKTITVTRSGTGTISIINNNPSTISATLSGNTITITGNAVNNASVTINIAQTSEYSGSSITYTCNVYKLENTITLSSNNDSILVGKTKTVTVTRSGTGTISIVNNNPSVIGATLSGNTITITGLTDGNASITVNVAGSTGYYSGSVTYNCESATIPESLNDASWDMISDLIKSGKFGNYYKVGDTKDITLNLPAGSYDLVAGKYFSNAVSGTYKVVVLGIDHNSTYEGTNRVHFCIGRNAEGTEIAFRTMKMNTSNTNSGGWKSCPMRTWLNETLINGLPSDLTSVITPCTKYTDNTGNSSNVEANVNATSDKLWLLSEFEVFGSRTYANQYEKNKQAQYDYYKNGASKVRYEHQSPSSSCSWWLRSANYNNSDIFCIVNGSGNASYHYAYYSNGVVPGFTIS